MEQALARRGTKNGQALQAIAVEKSGYEAQGASRELATLTTRQSATWDTATQPVYAIEVTVLGEAAGTANLNAAIGICFDAPNDTVADNWLTAGSHTATDAEHETVALGETRRFEFEYPLSRIDAKRLYGSENLRVKIKAEAATP